MSLSQTIKKARAEIGLTQEELANRIGVTQTTVWRWEEQDGAPKIDRLATLATVLNLDYDELLRVTVETAALRTAQRAGRQAAADRALRVVRDVRIEHVDGGDGNGDDSWTRQDPGPGVDGARGGRGPTYETRLASLEHQVRLILQRVASLAEALEAAGVVVPAASDALSGVGDGSATTPLLAEPPSGPGSPTSPPKGRRKRS